MKNPTLKQIIETLNGLVAPLVGKKVMLSSNKGLSKNFLSLHKEVRSIVSDYVESMNMECRVWDINCIYKEGSPLPPYIHLFSYRTVNLDKDKRITNTPAGVLTQIEFTLEEKYQHVDLNMTLEEYYLFIQKVELEERIKHTNERIEELKTKMIEETAGLNNLIKEQEELNNNKISA